ncbi:MAG: aldehyde dehydrogenase family protein [Sphingomonadaceae bacterium]
MEAAYGKFIDGRAVDPAPAEVRLPLTDPARGEVVAELAEAADPGAAVASAFDAHARGHWRRAPAGERAAVLRRIAAGLRAEAPAIAEADTRLTGLPRLRSTLRHVEAAAGWFDHFASAADVPDAPLAAPEGLSARVIREPHGVVALFTPWNIPAMSAALKAAAALAAGNAVVLKPSELAPASALAIARIAIEAGLPPGQLNVVQGRGPTVGAALAAEPRVRAISFTGGHAGGVAVAAAAAQRLCPVTLELGGKSAFILDASADVPAAMDVLMAAAFANNGEACLAASRLLLHESLADRLLPDLIARIEAIDLADPMDPACAMGPLVTAAHLEATLARIEAARRHGDRLLTGGVRAAERGPGNWFRPALIAPADNRSPAVQEEFFAPVLTVQTFATTEEALRLAGSTRYGLALYAWSRDPAMIAGVAQQAAGSISVNTPFHRIADAPFGGFGESGLGREGGRASIAFFTAEKLVLEQDHG